jgi:RES domain
MLLDATVVADLAIQFNPSMYLRVTPKMHRQTPLGMGFGETRFASSSKSFHLLYIAKDLATGVAEAIVRDRFEGKQLREIAADEVETWVAAEISTSTPLTVIDLRTKGLMRLGISTDAARGKAHEAGRCFSQALYDGFDVDGILYLSRLTGAECVAVYDRAVASKLRSARVANLVELAGLIPALQSLNVTLV